MHDMALELVTLLWSQMDPGRLGCPLELPTCGPEYPYMT